MAGKAAAILLAAGSGVRLGAGIPKALVLLAGVPLVRHAAEALAAVPAVEQIILVVPDGEDGARVSAAAFGAHPSILTVVGGARRRDSVLCGLKAAVDAEWVLVHDAARALAGPDLIERVFRGARIHGAAIPTIPVPDTLIREAGGFVGEELPRAGVHLVQTPQGFRREWLLEAHQATAADWDAPDDGTMVRRLGKNVALVPGDPQNFKITWTGDLHRAESFLAERRGAMEESRIGIGWDVHPFGPGRPTVLAGVVLAEEFGPLGHSDGDPLAHAICDALLGAAGLGDIGLHFPDTDPRWKGAPGPDLLARTAGILRASGWEPAQVDAVLITDKPKIGPAREGIRAGLAQALGLPEGAVNVKGKRTEGLGSLAGGAGIACHAVAVVRRSKA